MEKPDAAGDKLIEKLGFILSVPKSMHPVDTLQVKIRLMIGHAKDATKYAKQLQKRVEGLRDWLIKIRKSKEIMEARRLAEQALKDKDVKDDNVDPD